MHIQAKDKEVPVNRASFVIGGSGKIVSRFIFAEISHVNSQPIVNGRFLLEKFPGKGGWTYAALPGISLQKSTPFGWLQVSGFVDDHELKQYKLMPMGNGQLFLPVKAATRKKIGKQAGDWVTVVLFVDDNPLDIPGELLDCLRGEPASHDRFFKLTAGRQKAYIDWIYAAKTEQTRVNRIVELLDQLSRGNLPLK